VDENVAPSNDVDGVDYGYEFQQMKSKLTDVGKTDDTRKYVDMRDVSIATSAKNLPNFIHKLNLRLNLYEPDLQFKPLSKK
jgi:hypothetical protein